MEGRVAASTSVSIDFGSFKMFILTQNDTAPKEVQDNIYQNGGKKPTKREFRELFKKSGVKRLRKITKNEKIPELSRSQN